MVAVAEPNEERRAQFVQKHNINSSLVFHSYEALFAEEKFSDTVIVSTQDHDHYLPVIKALEKGYHVLVEKPMSPNVDECFEMVTKAKEKNRLLLLGYVLRYTPFFQKLKQLIGNGAIGNARHIPST